MQCSLLVDEEVKGEFVLMETLYPADTNKLQVSFFLHLRSFLTSEVLSAAEPNIWALAKNNVRVQRNDSLTILKSVGTKKFNLRNSSPIACPTMQTEDKNLDHYK